MVTTRRGAQSSQTGETASLNDVESIRKRKSGPKTAASSSRNNDLATSNALQSLKANESKKTARSTRSTKAVEREEILPSQVLDSQEASQLAVEQIPLRTRSRRVAAVEKAIAPETEPSQSQTVSSRSTRSLRGRKAAAQSSQLESQPEAEASVAARTRRGGKQAESQVVKEQETSQNTTQTSQTVEGEQEDGKSTKAKASLRKRRAAALEEPHEAEEAEQLVERTPIKRRRRAKRVPSERPTTPLESSMVTEATTPGDSPGIVFEQPKDYREDDVDAEVSDVEDTSDLIQVQSAQKHVTDDSDDELAGKNTPFRRRIAPKTATTRARSAKNVRTNTQRSTQTLGRSQQEEDDAASSTVNDTLSNTQVSQLSNDAAVVQAEHQTMVPDSMPEDAVKETSTDDMIDESFVLETLRDEDIMPYTEREILSLMSQTEHQPAATQDYFDPDATIAVEQDDDDGPAPQPPSPASDHSVIVTPHRGNMPEEEEEGDDDIDEYDDYTALALTAKTPRLQTIAWDNIQPDTAVRANLQMPASPQLNQNQLGTMPDAILSSPTKQAIAAEVEQEMLIVQEEALEFTEFVTLPTGEASILTSTPRPLTFVDAEATDDGSDVEMLDELNAAQDVLSATVAVVDPIVTDEGQEHDFNADIETPLSPVSQPEIEPDMVVAAEHETGPAIVGPGTDHKLDDPRAGHDTFEDHAVSGIDERSQDGETSGNERSRSSRIDEDEQAVSSSYAMPSLCVDQSSSAAMTTNDIVEDEPQKHTTEETPHYMQSTIAFDARRKSLPASVVHAHLIEQERRPFTSDGSSMSRATTPVAPWWLKSQSKDTSKTTTSTSPSYRHLKLAPFANAGRDRFTASVQASTPLQRRQSLPQDRARTIALPARYRSVVTPSRTLASSIRNLLSKTALTTGTPVKLRSPARTPLRSLIAPTVAKMTPHPAAPLRGVVAIVEVYTLEGASASAPFVALLHRLGAKTTKIWGDRITHVVFKDGSPSVLQKVFLHNKAVQKGRGTYIHCINSRWVSDCDTQSARVIETDSAYAVSTGDLSVASKRKRKSMEPSTVVNVGGNLIQHRKNSWGRSASGRLLGSPMVDSPSSKKITADKEDGAGNTPSPATPAWIKAPSSLVTATAPLKRVRNLDTAGLIRMKARRRTLLNID